MYWLNVPPEHHNIWQLQCTKAQNKTTILRDIQNNWLLITPEAEHKEYKKMALIQKKHGILLQQDNSDKEL
jgi:hypothetical protein